jgi:chloramphenicol-sensitive protein RarD
MSERGRGLAFAVAAYALWGLMPIYWKSIQAVPAPQLLAHRVLWSALALVAVLALRGRLGELVLAMRKPATRWLTALAGGLIALNWLTYVWAVNSGHILDTSLGYFINPLLNVVLGVLVLKEHLRPAQWMAVALAALGVVALAFLGGRAPWIALTLAGSFGVYSLVKKTSPLGSITGLALETLLLAPMALIWLGLVARGGHGPVGGSDALSWLLVAATGPVTALPLLLFAAGARRIPLSTLGLLQYLAPTTQFIIGWTLFGERVSPAQLAAYGVVWLALALFAAESFWRRSRVQAA